MHRLQSISKRCLAAIAFFTRLPLWRVVNIEKEHYEHVVPLWPLAGYVTGGTMAAVLWGGMAIGLSTGLSVALALTARVLLTGALHEDGFADFCDGFGGGWSRERTLAIMKDSHIGTYGVLGLVLYALIAWNTLTMLLDAGLSPVYIICIDALSKSLSSTIVCYLPYARTESEAKNKLLYQHPAVAEMAACGVLGVVPFVVAGLMGSMGPMGLIGLMGLIALLCCVGAIGVAVLVYTMHRRIGGYTGDCCGATVIIIELLLYITLCAIIHI